MDSYCPVGPEGIAYVALRRGAAPLGKSSHVWQRVLGPATALLSFFTTTDQALLFLFRAGWRCPSRIRDTAESRPAGLTFWSASSAKSIAMDPVYAEAKPGINRCTRCSPKLSTHLEGVERLILAPEGIGHLLPWGVLAERAGWHTSAGQPLPLVTLPALGILPRLRQRPHVPPGPALVVGNPRGDLPYCRSRGQRGG